MLLCSHRCYVAPADVLLHVVSLEEIKALIVVLELISFPYVFSNVLVVFQMFLILFCRIFLYVKQSSFLFRISKEIKAFIVV